MHGIYSKRRDSNEFTRPSSDSQSIIRHTYMYNYIYNKLINIISLMTDLSMAYKINSQGFQIN